MISVSNTKLPAFWWTFVSYYCVFKSLTELGLTNIDLKLIELICLQTAWGTLENREHGFVILNYTELIALMLSFDFWKFSYTHFPECVFISRTVRCQLNICIWHVNKVLRRMRKQYPGRNTLLLSTSNIISFLIEFLNLPAAYVTY